MTRILGLDCGKTVGWAVLDGPAQDCGSKSFAECADLGAIVSEFRRWLECTVHAENPDILAVERAFGRVRFVSDLPLILVGVAHAVAHDAGIVRVEWSASTLKKQITGSGKATKRDVVRAVRELGWRPDTDHAADAAACAVVTDRSQVPILMGA